MDAIHIGADIITLFVGECCRVIEGVFFGCWRRNGAENVEVRTVNCIVSENTLPMQEIDTNEMAEEAYQREIWMY